MWFVRSRQNGVRSWLNRAPTMNRGGKGLRPNVGILLALALLWAVVATGCAANPEAGAEPDAGAGEDGGEGQARLEVTGDSGTEFSGTCAVGDGDPEEIGGQVPQSYTYDLRGASLDCEIATEGDAQVTLAVGNDRSVQRVGGGTLNLTYENGSISSVASSSSTSSSSTSSQVVSSGATDEEVAGEGTGSSDNVVSESRDVGGFDEVELRGVGNLSIRQTGTEGLTVEAEEDVLPKIRTQVEDGRLVIAPESNTAISTTEPINYELTVDDLRALKLSGSGDVEAEGISTGELAVSVGGSGEVRISGEADRQQVLISGSGNYRAQDLRSKKVEIDVGGAGSAIVNASEALDARVSGAGSVEYVGDPTVEQEVSGAGQVSKH